MSVEVAAHQEKFGKFYEDFVFWPTLAPGQTILDLGCGGGLLTRRLAREFPECTIIGLDRREAILDVARARANEEGLKNTRFILGEISELNGLDLIVDGVFCRFLLENLPSPLVGAKRMHSLLRPGGWAVGVERLNFYCPTFPKSAAIDEVWLHIFRTFERDHGLHPRIAEGLSSIFSEAGFVNVTSQAYSKVVGKPEFGKTFDWYIRVAMGIVSDMKGVGPGLEPNMIEAALNDYEMLLRNPDAFLIESAMSVTGTKL